MELVQNILNWPEKIELVQNKLNRHAIKFELVHNKLSWFKINELVQNEVNWFEEHPTLIYFDGNIPRSFDKVILTCFFSLSFV